MTSEVVAIIDDDPDVRDTLTLALGRGGFDARAFASAEGFLADRAFDECSCVITDVDMGGMSGIELQKEIAERRPILPVIIISGKGNIPMAVAAVQAGALDFIPKPFKMREFLEKVDKAVALFGKRQEAAHFKACAEHRLEALSGRELEVFRLITDGHSNKAVGGLLGISEKTVESHRAKITRKVGTHDMAELIRLRTGAGEDA
ncbi:MAG: response regulator [Sphingomonadales bacterium]